MPRLSLVGVAAKGPRLRNHIRREQLSTLEAIAHALERLEGPERTAPLWDMHAKMVEGTQRGRGSYRARAN
jgi:DTW domain-containing protein YfiP